MREMEVALCIAIFKLYTLTGSTVRKFGYNALCPLTSKTSSFHTFYFILVPCARNKELVPSQTCLYILCPIFYSEHH